MNSHLAPSILLGAGLLAGCAAAPDVKPASEPPISVTLVHADPGPMSLATYADDFDCYGQQGIDLGGIRTTTLSAPAKAWQTFQFGFAKFDVGVIHQCVATGSFRTDSAHEYRVQFGGSGSEGCGMDVQSRLAGTQDPMTSVTVEGRQGATPFIDPKGPWCKPDPRFQGSSTYLTPRR